MRVASVFGFIRLFNAFRRRSFRDRKLDWLLCDHPFLRGSNSPHRGVLDARSRGHRSPHVSTPARSYVPEGSNELRKFQGSRDSTRCYTFFFAYSSPPRRHRAERRPFPTFPGGHCCPSSVILLHGRFFYPFSWRSHGVASETARMPAKARVLAAAQNRSPIYVRYMTTPGEHIVSVRLFPYRASPAISTRNPYPVS